MGLIYAFWKARILALSGQYVGGNRSPAGIDHLYKRSRGVLELCCDDWKLSCSSLKTVLWFHNLIGFQIGEYHFYLLKKYKEAKIRKRRNQKKIPTPKTEVGKN